MQSNVVNLKNMFAKAERKQAKIKIALTGASGTGKTFSSLMIAQGLGQKIAVIDTENGSASLYADRFDFDVVDIAPPFTTDKYLTALEAARQAGYDCVIIDSISHQWEGEGSILDRKTAMDGRGGNSFTNWGKFTPEHEKFKSAIVQSPMHIICTMRSKTEYVIEQNERGKSAPKKMGTKPIQRDGFEYEFTCVFNLADDHSAIATKDRTGLFDNQLFKPNNETGEKLRRWLSAGKLEAVQNVKTGQNVQSVQLRGKSDKEIDQAIADSLPDAPSLNRDQLLNQVRALYKPFKTSHGDVAFEEMMKHRFNGVKDPKLLDLDRLQALVNIMKEATMSEAIPAPTIKPVNKPLEAAVAAVREAVQGREPGPTDKQLKRLFAIMKTANVDDKTLKDEMYARWGISSRHELDKNMYEQIYNWLENYNKPKAVEIPQDNQPSWEDALAGNYESVK